MNARSLIVVGSFALAGATLPGSCTHTAPAASVAPPATTPPADPVRSDGGGTSVRTFGAVCDGKTDDSDALQAGITAAAAQGFVLLIPVGHCNFSRTLTIHDGPRGVAIRGERGQGASGSYLRYTGSGTALSARNPTAGAFVYNLVFQDFGLVAGANAAVGLDALFLSEAQLRNFGVFAGEGRFGVGLRCKGCNIVYFDAPIFSGNSAGMELIDPAAIFISHGDFYAHATWVLKFEGAVTHVVVRDSWFETQDFALLFDTADVTMVEVTGNRFLLNGGAAYPNQIAVQFDDSAGAQVNVRGFHFSGNSAYCAPGLCAAPFFIRTNLPDSASGSSVTAWIEHNVLLGNGTEVIGGLQPAGTLRSAAMNNDVGESSTGQLRR